MEGEFEKDMKGITSFVLHITAMGFMLCDHLWVTFLGEHEWLGYVGRLAFPMFAFMIAEGFVHTRNRKKYAMRMFLFGLISEIPFDLMVSGSFVYPFHQNVLWTFLISIGVLSLYEKIQTYKSVLARVVLMVLVTLGGYLLGFVGFVDYFGCGILMVVLFYFTRMDASMKWPHRAVLCFIQLVGMYWINCEMLKGMMIPVRIFGFTVEVHKQGIAILSLPLIWLYNGKQGVYNKIIKNVYYWFYPVHLLLLGILGAVS